MPIELWWVLPAAVAFSTVAVGSGVSGALFFSPFFMLVVGLSPAQAVGAGLLTEVFGMGNGLRSYVRQRVVDYSTARWILAASIPTVVGGALVAHHLSADLLRGVFGGGLLVLAAFLYFNASGEEEGSEEENRAEETRMGDRVSPPPPDHVAAPSSSRTIVSADGRTYRLPECGRGIGLLLSGLGGTLTGLISAGLPEITTTQLVTRCRVPPRVAVATSVFTLAVTAVAGAAVHALAARPAWDVVVWSIPGVLVGSTLGSVLGSRVPARLMERALSVVFAAVGILVLGLLLAPLAFGTGGVFSRPLP